MEIIEFEKGHAQYLLAEGGNTDLCQVLGEEHLDFAETLEYAYTGVEGETPVFCAGLVPMGSHCAEAWAILHQFNRDGFMKTFNACKRLLEVSPYQRVECRIRYNYKEGHRWAKALGFKLEAKRMQKSNMQGYDESLYARIYDGH